MNSTISLLILAKNEEKNIGECIKSCTFANEVIVIDDHSNDETPIIAESLGAKVITRDMNGDWGKQQTFAIEQAKSDWIFLLMLMNVVHQSCVKKLKRLLRKDSLWVIG